MKKILIMSIVVYAAFLLSAEDTKKIVFTEQQIEGKIRRPQLVLIKAEQRPEFPPMVLKSLGGNANVVEFVTPSIISDGPYDKAFLFEGDRITNYTP
jgi:hypothetical protein